MVAKRCSICAFYSNFVSVWLFSALFRRDALSELKVLSCSFIPGEADRFIVGTDTGHVTHESRFRDFCTPHQFKAPEIPSYIIQNASSSSKESSSERINKFSDPVVSISFNSHKPELFLCGYLSGMVCLYSINKETHLESWNLPHTIRQLHWSPQRPAVFYALDESSTIHVWDLLERSNEPIHSVAFEEGGGVAGFTLSPTVTTAKILGSQMNLSGANSRNATIVLSYWDGEVEAHILNEELGEVAIDELEQFEQFIQRKQ
jgi:WD40 repeat protein